MKFRCWHKKRKKMYEVLHLHLKDWDNGGEWVTARGFNILTQQDIHIDIQPKDCIILEYSGLKDNLGKEIYEGDIVEVTIGDKTYQYVIVKEIGSFMLCNHDEQAIHLLKNSWNDTVYPLSQLYYEYDNEEKCIDQLRIITNRYEDPVLTQKIV